MPVTACPTTATNFSLNVRAVFIRREDPKFGIATRFPFVLTSVTFFKHIWLSFWFVGRCLTTAGRGQHSFLAKFICSGARTYRIWAMAKRFSWFRRSRFWSAEKDFHSKSIFSVHAHSYGHDTGVLILDTRPESEIPSAFQMSALLTPHERFSLTCREVNTITYQCYFMHRIRLLRVLTSAHS